MDELSDNVLTSDDDIEILDVVPSTSKAIEVPVVNPVEQNLMKQLECVQNRIDQTNYNIETIQDVTKKILSKISLQTAYEEEVSSESDSDLFDTSGKPVLKVKKNLMDNKQQVLSIENVWHRVIDDHWIIGAVIQNTTSWILKEPTIYVALADRDDITGTSTFWTLDKKQWYCTEEILENEQVIATAVISLPVFQDKPYIDLVGTIFAEHEGKIFQTPMQNQRLEVNDVIDGSYSIDFSEDYAKFSILALKSMSIEKMINLPFNDSRMGQKLQNFVDRYEFQVIENCFVVRNAGSLQYCIMEISPPEENEAKISLTARSEAQLSAVIHALRENFPEIIDNEKETICEDALLALKEELALYLNCTDLVKIQNARMKTDLLIP